MIERTPLEPEVPTQNTCWALVERVAESSQLRRSARLKNLLFYVGKRSLREGLEEVHEQEIGVEVYGRAPGYDTNVDNIVRVNASELRKRIASYFETEGLHEPLIMEIPRGRYVPAFRYRFSEAPKVATTPGAELQAAAEPVAQTSLAIEVPDGPAHSHRISFSALLAATAIVILAISCVTLWRDNRSLHRAVHPWQYQTLVAQVWGPFLDGSRDTDVVMEDSSFLLVQNIDKKTFSFNEYISRSYLDSQQESQLSSEIRNIEDAIAGKTLARAAEVRLILKIAALDSGSRNLHIYNAREYTPALLNRNNVILLGNPTSNPWFDLFQARLNFQEQPESQSESIIMNRSPATREHTTYTPTGDIAYGVVAYLPKSDYNGHILLIEGTSSEATEACGNFILSEYELSNVAKLLNTTRFPYFELLLKISHVTGTPITATIEAYRTYPNLK